VLGVLSAPCPSLLSDLCPCEGPPRALLRHSLVRSLRLYCRLSPLIEALLGPYEGTPKALLRHS